MTGLLYKVFHTIAPHGGLADDARAKRFFGAWDEFAGQLARLAEGTMGFRFYTRTPRTGPTPASSDPAGLRHVYDAVDVVAFDGLENALAFRTVAQALDASSLEAASTWLVTEEHIAINGTPKGPLDTGYGVHVINAMRRKPGLSVANFRAHWADHAQYVAATQGMSRYAANHIVDAEYEAGQPPADGFVEAWFPSPEHQRACFTDPLMTGVQQQHNAVFIDTRSFSPLQAIDAEQWVRGDRSSAIDIEKVGATWRS